MSIESTEVIIIFEKSLTKPSNVTQGNVYYKLNKVHFERQNYHREERKYPLLPEKYTHREVCILRPLFIKVVFNSLI